jgi:hypothetical protein
VPRLRLWAPLAGGTCTALMGGCAKPGASGQAPPSVSVAQVLERKVIDWDEFTVRFQAIETVEIRPRVSGYIDLIKT